jgi:hypothetical protein
MGDFLELWGGKKLIDIMVPWTFSVDWKLYLIRSIPHNFFPRFAPWG